jgi:hypothetical protein
MTQPLQTKWIDMMADGEWFEALIGLWSAPTGRAIFAMLVGMPTVLSLWSYSESIVPPATMLTLFAGLFIAQLPTPAASVGYVLAVAGLAGGLFALARRRL